MTKEQARNLANECVNALISAGVLEEQRDFFALDLITERILVNTPAPVNHSKTTPVMETTIEGAQKRIAKAIEDYADRCKFIGDPRETNPDLEYIAVFLDSVGDEMAAITSSCNSLHGRYVDALNAIDEWKERLDQLQSDFDTVDAEATTHLADKIRMQKEIDKLRKENEALRKGNLNNLHAAHDNR